MVDANFLPGELFGPGTTGPGLGQMPMLGLETDLQSRLAELRLLDDSQEMHGRVGGDLTGTAITTDTAKEVIGQSRGVGLGVKKVGVTSAVSDESVAGDSGVYEPSEKRPGLPAELLIGYEESGAPGCSQVSVGLHYEAKEQRFSICILQLANCSALTLPQDHSSLHVRVAVLPCSEATQCLFRTSTVVLQEAIQVNEVFGMHLAQNALRQKTLRLDVCVTAASGREHCVAGAQISLADVTSSGERQVKWYNLLSHSHISSIERKSTRTSEQHTSDTQEMPLYAASHTSAEPSQDWPETDGFEDEDGSEVEEEEFYPESSQWEAEVEEAAKATAQVPTPVHPPPTLTEKVNKETSMDGMRHQRTSTSSSPSSSTSVVRPKERRQELQQQNPFIRGNTIIRSKTFSPGPQSQYICRINRSDSDSSTLSKKSPFVRNASERRSVRMKKPPLVVRGVEHTSLDLELDLHAVRTRHSRLSEELRVLRQLKTQLETARQQGHTQLPASLQQDDRVQLLLKQAERQTKEELQQEQRVERMMRVAVKDVHKISGQSRKEMPEVQSFREKMAFFTRAKINVPDLPADDV